MRIIIALLAGALLPLAFAPIGFYPLAIVAPLLLLAIWFQVAPRQAFYQGFVFGLGFFGIGASWVYVSIHEFGNTAAPLAIIFTTLFVAVLALFPAIQGWLFAKIYPKPSLAKALLAFPALWTLMEWVRSWILSGFPWLLLGASQVTSPLRGFAPIIGEYGISLIVAFSSALCFVFFQQKGKTRHFCLVGFLTLWLCGLLLLNVHWTQPEGKPIQVSLVQGDIPQALKWDQAYVQTTLKRYLDLTEPYWHSSLIIWPEAAIPLLAQDAKPFLTLINTQATQAHATLMTGIPVQDGFTYYNAMLALGNGQGIYYKRHLVPFGEYLPFSSLLRGLINFFNIPMSDFSEGPEHQALMQANGHPIAAFICYEIAYPELVRTDLPQAKLLINISDDAWFGHSFAAAQQLQIGQMRALETGRYALFSTNNGITAIVSPDGAIQARAPAFQPAVLTGQITFMQGETPWVKLGTYPLLILLSIFCAIAFAYSYHKKA